MLNELQSKGDLAGFLGLSLEKLDFFVYPTSMYDLYRNRLVPKRNGGYRELLIPRSDLKRAQRLIASELEKGYKPLPCVHGFVKGRSIKTNAENHIGSQVIVGLDIKDFFPSISSRRVYGLLVSKKLGLTPEVAFCISRIVATPKGLPQGAPSSPIISNMICLGMDKQLMHLSREYRYQYSRYADDLTFSFNSSYLVLTSFIEIFIQVESSGCPISYETQSLTSMESNRLSSTRINRFTVAVFQDNWSRALSAIKRQI